VKRYLEIFSCNFSDVKTEFSSQAAAILPELVFASYRNIIIKMYYY